MKQKDGKQKFGRRDFLKQVGGTIATIGALSSASYPVWARPEKLRIAIYGYMTKGIPFYRMIARHKERHPNLVVTVDEIPGQRADWMAFFQKRRLEARKKTASHDAYIGITPFVNGATLARAGIFDPIDKYLPSDVMEDMFDSVKQECTFVEDGRVYELPWWTDVFGLISRKSMLKEAVGTEKPPKTWDGVFDYADKIDAHYEKIYAFGADWPSSHRLAIPLLGSITDEPFVEMEGFKGVLNVDSDAFTKTLEIIKRLYPYMPPNSQADLGCSKAFQSGALAMETYWQPQMLRAIQAGQPKEDIQMSSFPKVNYPNTVFWTAGLCIPKYGKNKEALVDFIVEAMLEDPKTREWTVVGDWKIMAYDSIIRDLRNKGILPDWAPPLVESLKTAQPIPMNGLWLGVENPAYKTEVEKMLLQDQPLEATQQNISDKIHKGLKEMQK